MDTQNGALDIVIVGAGPAGLACAISAQQNGLSYLVIDKGCLVNSIFHFPTNVTLFSTADLLEIGGVPFIIASEKPNRLELVNYYRGVARHYNLKLHLYEKVKEIRGRKGWFEIHTEKATYVSRNVVLATGQYDQPRRLGVPGEDLPKVSHYYTEGHPYFGRKVAVIGGKNSAVETALDLYRHGAEVTLIHRGAELGRSVKYWIRPDLENRIKEGAIRALFNTVVKEIRETDLIVQTAGSGEQTLANDFVFAMTGYTIDAPFLRRLGVEIDPDGTPRHNPNTLETNVPGLYIAGVVTAGDDGGKVFIENSRNHGTKITGHILNGAN